MEVIVSMTKQDMAAVQRKMRNTSGLNGHVLIGSERAICGYTFAAANIDERDVL